MQEFTAVTASTASGLADALNQHAADGWALVQVVNAGDELAAILSRDAHAVSVDEPAPIVDVTPEPAADDTSFTGDPIIPIAAVAAAGTIDEPAGWGSAPDPAVTEPEVVAEPAASPSLPSGQPTYQAAEPAAAAAAPAAPAVPSGWYADPSGRFELRYWDGGAWTEHVSRAGQQYTDPPVA